MNFYNLVLVMLALNFLFLVQPVYGTCCHRKPDFGCCGHGHCNVFCCHCHGGCNEECQHTHCNSWEWARCAVVVTRCASSCYDLNAISCVQCMGSSYNVCKHCYFREDDISSDDVSAPPSNETYLQVQ